MCGGRLDGGTGSWGSADWRCNGGSDLAWCSWGEHSGRWHRSASGERPVGDSDGLRRSSGVGGCLRRSWHDEGGACWADGGIALDGCGAVDDTSGGDGDAGGESCGLGECAWALRDGEGLGFGGGVGFAVLDDSGCERAEGGVGGDDLGGGGCEGGGGCLVG